MVSEKTKKNKIIPFFSSVRNLKELARRVALLKPSVVPTSLSIYLFFRAGGVPPHESFLTPKFSRCPLNLRFLVSLVVFSISFSLQGTQPCYLFKIGRIENPLCTACGHPTQHTFYLSLVQFRTLNTSRSSAIPFL